MHGGSAADPGAARIEPEPTPAPSPTPAVPESLAGRALGGAVWSMVGFGGSQLIRLCGNLILTRLLYAELFGLMALVQVLLQGLVLFSDVGIGPAIIRSKRGDEPAFLNTAFTLQALRGLGLWVCACAIAAPFSRFYGDPRLLYLVPFLALSSVLQGLQSTKLETANREIALVRVNLMELTSQIGGTIVMVVWAWFHRSLAALAVGGLVTAMIKLAFTHLALPGVTNRFCWDRAAAREIFGFGRWIFVSTVFTFLAGQSDRLIFGKLVAFELLGVYGIAATLAAIPSMALGQLRSAVFYPLYSRVVVRGEDLPAEMRRTRRPLLVAGAWATCGLMAGGPTAIRLLYDARYAEGGWMVQWAAIGLWFLLLEGLNGVGLLALGRSKWMAAGSFAKFVGMAVMIPLGYHLAAFPGAVAAVALSEGLRYLVSCILCEAVGIRCWPRDLVITAMLLACAGAVRLLVTQLGGRISVATEAALVTVLVTLAFLPLGWSDLSALVARMRRRGGGTQRP